MTPLAKNNLAAPDIRLGDRGSLNGTLKKSGSVGRWETKQFIGMA